MLGDFGENLMHNNERNFRKGGLDMAAFNRFVNVYHQRTHLHVYTVAALLTSYYTIIDRRQCICINLLIISFKLNFVALTRLVSCKFETASAA